MQQIFSFERPMRKTGGALQLYSYQDSIDEDDFNMIEN